MQHYLQIKHIELLLEEIQKLYPEVTVELRTNKYSYEELKNKGLVISIKIVKKHLKIFVDIV